MMRLPRFRYRAPGDLGEALAVLAGEGPQASLLAGPAWLGVFLLLILTGLETDLALIRRLGRATGHVVPELRCGPVALDPRAARVTHNGTPVKLTSHEFRVLSYLMHHHGRIVSQGELTEHIYSQGFDRDSNTVEVFIARLRRKLGPAFIETVRGMGYRISQDRL